MLILLETIVIHVPVAGATDVPTILNIHDKMDVDSLTLSLWYGNAQVVHGTVQRIMSNIPASTVSAS